MTFKLTILGSSSALPTSSRFPAAHVLNVHERFFLIDCGEGTQMQIRNCKIGFGKINHIFISHLHGDHYFGLMGLISTLGLLGRKVPLHIYAHKDLQTIIMQHLRIMFQRGEKLGYRLAFHHLTYEKPAVIFEDSKLTVTSFPMVHRIPACGFLFKEKEYMRNIIKPKIQFYNVPLQELHGIKQGADFVTEEGKTIPNKELTLAPYKQRSYAYCSDTAYHEPNAEVVKGVDLLFHEATFLDDLSAQATKTKHSTAKQAAKIAQLAKAKKLLLGHFSSRYPDFTLFRKEAQTIFKNTSAVREGDEYEVELTREENKL